MKGIIYKFLEMRESPSCQKDVPVGILLIDIWTFFLEIFLVFHMVHLEVYL